MASGPCGQANPSMVNSLQLQICVDPRSFVSYSSCRIKSKKNEAPIHKRKVRPIHMCTQQGSAPNLVVFDSVHE